MTPEHSPPTVPLPTLRFRLASHDPLQLPFQYALPGILGPVHQPPKASAFEEDAAAAAAGCLASPAPVAALSDAGS